MPEGLEFTKVDGVLIPNRMLEYAKFFLPPELRRAALNYYMIFGRQSAETVSEWLEKYQNIICNKFPIDNMQSYIGTKEGQDVVFRTVENYLAGTFMGAKIRVLFEIFKPWIHAYMDPAYVMYNISIRRPQAYEILRDTPGGFEYVREICEAVRERYGMKDPRLKPYLLESSQHFSTCFIETHVALPSLYANQH